MRGNDLSWIEAHEAVERFLSGIDEGVVVHVVRRDSSCTDFVGLVNSLPGQDNPTFIRFDQK